MRPFELDDLYELQTPSDPRISPDGSRVAYVVTQADRDTDGYRSQIWVGDRAFTHGPSDSAPRWSPDGSEIAFLRGGRLWSIPARGGEPRRLADVEAASPVWSPDGRALAFVSKVGGAADTDPVVLRELPWKADGSGLDRGARAHLFVVAATGGEPRQITEGDFNVGWPAWSPDGTRIAFTSAMHATRERDFASHVFVLDVASGAIERVTDGPGSASAPCWTPDGARIVFAGMPYVDADHTTLFVVDAGGGTPDDLLEGFDRNVMVGAPGYPGAPPQLLAGDVVFCARDRGATHAYRAPIDGSTSPEKIVGDDRTVTGLSVTSAIAYTTTGFTDPGSVWTLDRAVATFPLEGVEIPAPERRTFTAPDGTAIDGWVLGAGDAPRPMLLDIHGGPHNAWGPGFPRNYWLSLAARGWCVLFVNPRGSDGYGRDFFRGVLGGWGTHDLDDFLCAVDALVADGTADPSQLAVTGYSYGGYMTNRLATRTDRFASAVSGGCVSDATSFYGTCDVGIFCMERELRAEAFDDPALYRRVSPLADARDVTTPMLILHGERDDRCPVGEAEQWFSTLRRLGREAEMVLYPGASHLFILNGRPSHRIDYARRVEAWVTARTREVTASSS